MGEHDDDFDDLGHGAVLQLTRVTRGLDALLGAVRTNVTDTERVAREFERAKGDLQAITRAVDRLSEVVHDSGDDSLVSKIGLLTYRVKALEEQRRDFRSSTTSWSQLFVAGILSAALGFVAAHFDSCNRPVTPSITTSAHP
jgi:hypothetical protein